MRSHCKRMTTEKVLKLHKDKIEAITDRINKEVEKGSYRLVVLDGDDLNYSFIDPIIDYFQVVYHFTVRVGGLADDFKYKIEWNY